jgi:putative protease
MNVPELLAPAATFACAKAAFDNGADAVYAGMTTHNLRARSDNFGIEELGELCACADGLGTRVYVALNSMPDDQSLADIDESLASLAKRTFRPHALIVSDPGVIGLCQSHLPDVALHLSTQTGTFNSASAGFWAKQGIRRIILPREMTLDRIKKIASLGSVETEVFIHGAMCVSVSGRCLLGAYMAGRHPNLGDCPQPCRLRYRIAPQRGPDNDSAQAAEWYTVEEEQGAGASILNSKDLCALPVLDRIVKSGVSAVKIEGRHRSMHYVASVVKVYRAALDSIASGTGGYSMRPEWKEELSRLDHRPYTTGFYAGEYCIQDVTDAQNRSREFRVVGVVRELIDGSGAVVDVKNPFLPGDAVSVLPAGPLKDAFDATVIRMTDLCGHETGRALTGRLVLCVVAPTVGSGDILRKQRRPF